METNIFDVPTTTDTTIAVARLVKILRNIASHSTRAPFVRIAGVNRVSRKFRFRTEGGATPQACVKAIFRQLTWERPQFVSPWLHV